MRIVQLLRLGAFLLIGIAPKFLVAGNENATAPIILTIPNSEKIATCNEIRVHASLNIPQGTVLRHITPDNSKGYKEPITIRTASLIDGKVDVDIIIKIAFYTDKMLPLSDEPTVRINVGMMSFITVDNISGVFQNGNNSGQNPAHLQDVSVFIDNNNTIGNSSENNIANGSTLDIGEFQLNEVSSIQPIRNTSIDILLFPNPVNGSTLNITSKFEMDGASEILIHNAIGNLVKKQSVNQSSGNNTIQIGVDELSTGIYFLTLRNPLGESVKKFTIAH